MLRVRDVTQILAVANQKGGVGKTTTTLNLGLVLAERCRVLLIDLDPQASLTAFLGLDPYRQDRSSYSLLMYDNMALTRTLKPLHSGLAIVPGSVDLQSASIRLVQEPHPLDRLQKALHTSHLAFDYVLIDTPPGLNVLTVAGLIAADEMILPVQPNHTAILGVRAVQDVARRIRDQMGNPRLKLRGILTTFYDLDATFSGKVLDELEALLPGQVFKTRIPYDVQIADAPHTGRAVVDYAPASPGAAAYRALAEEISGATTND